MNEKLVCLALAATVASSALAYVDKVRISPTEGEPGDLVTIEVYLTYEGSGPGDSISAFDIPLTWDASVCSVEAIELGYRFRKRGWVDVSQFDNQGVMGPPAVPKLTLSGYRSDTGRYFDRGSWKAGNIGFRILDSLVPPDSACLDTLMEAFSPSVNLRFVDKQGINTYIPSFVPGCLRYYGFADSVWIVGTRGVPGDLAQVEVWLQYKGYGTGDMISCFDIPLIYDAAVCTVEAITLGPHFGVGWDNTCRIDNQGTDGDPAVPKILVSGWTGPWISSNPQPRGSHLAGTVDFRILETVVPPDSTCIDTLMNAFFPSLYLGFYNGYWEPLYVPTFSTDCIRVSEYPCGDCNADGRITSADIVYMGNYIYGHGPDPYGQTDVNLDGRITVADAIYIGNYIYRRGPEPCNPQGKE